MLPLIQSGVFDVYTSTQQSDIVSDERRRGMEVDPGSAAVLCCQLLCNSMRWVCVCASVCTCLSCRPPMGCPQWPHMGPL